MSSKVYSTGDRATDLEPPGQQPSALPEASAEAIDFLDSLEKEELKLVLFSETLAIVSDTGEPQGELTIEVKRGKYKDNLGIMSHCLLVHALSRGFLDGVLCGNSLLGYLAKNLEPMEQHSHEYIKFPILPMERKTSMTRQDDRLVVTRTVKEGETVKTNVTSFPWNSLAGFVSSAANLVLLRVMAWRQMVPDNAYFLTLDNEGKLCHCTYQALGYQTIQVGHQEAEMFIVEQTVHSDENIPFSCQFYLLSDGHLAKRVQVGSPGCCIISKMPVLREEDEIESQPEFEKKPLEWKEDLELYLRFLDRKEQLRLSHARYLRQHPEALAAVSDFLLFLLIRQPEDVLTYAAEHFGSYSSKHQPTPYVRSSHPPSPFRVLEEEESEEVFQVEESTMDNYDDQDDQDADYADHVRDDDNDYDNDYDDDDNDDDDDNYYDDDDDDDDNDYDDDDDDDDDNDDDNDDDDDDDNDNDQDNDDDNNDNDNNNDNDKTDDNKENKEELG